MGSHRTGDGSVGVQVGLCPELSSSFPQTLVLLSWHLPAFGISAGKLLAARFLFAAGAGGEIPGSFFGGLSVFTWPWRGGRYNPH